MEERFQPGTIKPESHYQEIEELSRSLGIPVPMAFVTVETFLPDGSPDYKHHDRSRTWNRNFWNLMLCTIASQDTIDTNFGAGYLSLKDLTGNMDVLTPPYGFSIANTSTSTTGIVVGTGAGAEDFEGNTMAIVENGTGVGQMQYGSVSGPVVTYTSGTKTWTAASARTMTTNTGSSITVTETGLVTLATNNPASMLICRDLLGTPVLVGAGGGQIVVTYTLSLIFPA
jgi:hypothetical protein